VVKCAPVDHADTATTADKTATTKPSTLGDQMFSTTRPLSMKPQAVNQSQAKPWMLGDQMFKSLGRHRKVAVQKDNKKEVLDENARDKHALREQEIKEKAAEGRARALKHFEEMQISKKASQQKELAEKGSQGCPGRKRVRLDSDGKVEQLNREKEIREESDGSEQKIED
jgi:hypothetical protein